MKPIILYTCDDWKSWDSARVYGVFTNRQKLNRHLYLMERDGRIKWHGENKNARHRMAAWTLREIHDRMDGLIIQEIDFNQNTRRPAP